MKRSMGLFLMLAGIAFGLTGCATAPKDEKHRQALVDEAHAALTRLEAKDAGLESFLRNAYGYAIFPHVGKGGLGVGGAYGRGVVYEQGRMVGYADLTQATIGLQLGGQTFAELIVFQDKNALDNFKNNQLAFQAGASAVAVNSGAATNARYTNGVAVFVEPIGGLMVEAAVGGQKFTFVPVADQSAMRGLPPPVQAAPEQPAPPPHFEATGSSSSGTGSGVTAGATVGGSSSDRPSAAASVSSSPPPAAAPTTRPSSDQPASPPPVVDIGTTTDRPAAGPGASPPAPGAPATRPTTAPSTGG